jgi:hypothetical protein
MASSETPFLSNQSQFIAQENREVMVHNGCFSIMENGDAVLSIRNLAETISDWNLWSACDQHPQSDLQQSSLSQEL